MSTPDSPTKRVGVFLPPGKGRSYPMGRISAVFKARLQAMTAARSSLFIVQLWPPVGVTMVHRNCGPTITQTTTVRSFSIPMDTTSKRFATKI